MFKPRATGKIFLATILFLGIIFTGTAFGDDLILNDLESNPVNLSRLSGKPSIIFFWTTWCPYCRNELKTLNKMYAQMEKEGISVFAVNVGESGYKVKNFLKNYALSIKVLLDRYGQAADNYNIRGVPTYIFVDKDGRVVSVEHALPQNYKSLLLD